jgi:hypothetical protein
LNEALLEYEKRAKVGKARNREVGKFKKVIKDKEKESMK